MRLSPSRPWTEGQTRLAALFLPLAAVLVGLKLAKIALRPECFAPGGSLLHKLGGWFYSDLFMLGAFFVLCIGALWACRTSRQRRGVQIGLQVLIGLVAAFDVIATEYFLVTETTLDFALVASMVERPRDALTLMVGGGSASAWLVLAGSVAAIAVAPWRTGRRWNAALSSGMEPSADRLRSIAGTLLCLGSLPLAMLGLSPPTWAGDRNLLRDPVLNLVATAIGDARRAEPQKAPLQHDPELERARAARFDVELQRVDSRPHRNVVVIVLESTRAKSVGAYQPGLVTTPFFDELATHSLKVERAYSVVPSTAKALSAVFCGSEPSHSPRLPVSEPGSTSGCLPRHLAGEGYDSVFFSSQFEAFEALGEEARMLGFQAGVFPGENDVVGFKKANYVSYEDDVMLAPSERWLGAHKDRPFLAGYLTGATHHSCLPPSGRHGAISFSDDRAVDRYANSVRYEDFFLRALFEQYRALGLYENTLFVIVGDHGESFGEHSRYVHTDVPWEEGLRVPMIFHDPKGETFKAGTVQGPANQLDIVPSLLEALGLRVSRGFLPGTSVLHLPAGRAVMASCFDRLWCLTRIEAGEKLILHFGHLPDQLFDLLHDPGETVNLAAAQPEKVGRWRNDLLAWDERVSHLYGDSPPTVVNAAAPQTP